MTQENQPIIVNLPEGQNTLNLLEGRAPKQLDNLAPVKTDISGTIEAPLRYLEKRVGDIDQHKAYLLVYRDNLSLQLIINEGDPYLRGEVNGVLKLSSIFKKFWINSDRQWQPENLGQFLKLNRTYFANRDENMNVVNELKTFSAKVNQTVQRETKENGNRAFSFRQAVESNIPESFKLRMPIFSGGETIEFDVETYAYIDGSDVTISLQSAGANDKVEEFKQFYIDEVVNKIKEIAPELVIIEQ